jgi:magnesium transporter
MVTRHTRQDFTWVDLEAPDRNELHAVMEEFGIHAEIEEEIVAPTPYPLVALFPGHAYLVLHFPTADLDGGTRAQEIDVIIGKNFMVTARYELVGTIVNLHKAFEAEEMLGTESVKVVEGPAIIERVLRKLYAAMSDEVEQTAQALDKIERDIFSGKERTTVHAISETGRLLLRFETTLARHREPLATFLKTLSGASFFGKKFALPAARIEAERAHVAGLVGAYKAVANELRTTNDSLLSSSQNEVMKIFTAISVVLLPLTLIAALFGMHTKHGPILGTPHDFWIIILLMVIVATLSVVFMKFKKWM